MPDLNSLTQAFAELERCADAADFADPVPLVRHRHRTLLVAASAVGVAAVATGSALLAGGSDSPSRAPAGGAPHTSAAAPSDPARSEPAPPAFRIPTSPHELADRFRMVLGDTATFTVTDTGHAITMGPMVVVTGSVGSTVSVPIPAGEPNGAAIVGVLTASGVSGGYDIQIFQSDPGAKATCDDPDSSTCTVRRLADGSSLATGREPLQNNADGVTYLADLVRADGVEFLMHVSNERDPKGESAVLAPHPPLTTDEMTSILRSDRW